MPYRVVLNKALIEKLIINEKANCYLWTKADKNRANKIIDYCKLDKYFKDIIFDDKDNFGKSILRLNNIVKSDQFIIYENNSLFFANQNCKIVDEIKNKFFNIKAYLVGYKLKRCYEYCYEKRVSICANGLFLSFFVCMFSFDVVC